MLTYGCTRLEIGVQSTYEDVARDTNRGHTVAAVADCFCLAKDAGFKVYPYRLVFDEYLIMLVSSFSWQFSPSMFLFINLFISSEPFFIRFNRYNCVLTPLSFCL